ncbi:membrane protein [Devosia pacifica]|uniref:Membrane protein n=1 Tax=Devosia pacifica TaxID=1335967 RepID=A0A918S927_9HYPH|nr:DUF599 domain-containing protein [Devosia pacifica]GHA27157.1 membrane protein [Devosia pacifica]
MTLLASVFPLICYFAYNLTVPLIERKRPSLSVIMNIERRRWVANAAKRENPFDAILAGNIMSSVSFLASTAALLVLAVVAVFGQLSSLMSALDTIAIDRVYSSGEVVLHLVVMLAMFVLAFFAFTLALRQFNHFCILLGAIDHAYPPSDAEVEAIAQINSLGAQNFNAGVRAYYFSVATVAWFAAEWLSIVTCIATILILIHREFFSSAHRVAASAAVLASRQSRLREKKETDPA